MELKIKKGDFLNLLKWTQGIVEKRGTMPILSNLLLEATPGVLRLSATDLEISLSVEGKAEVKTAGRAVVNARNLYEIVREAPEDAVKVSGKGSGVEISSGKSNFKVIGMNPEEFPTLPQVSKAKSGEEVKIEPAELEEMIEKTVYASSGDETRYTLNGLYLAKIPKGDKNLLRLVATDGHRLSYVERESDKKWKLEKGIIIPRKGVAEVRKLLADGEGELGISVDEKSILFHRGSVSLIVRLIEGEFPNYEQVIPKKTEKVISASRELLIGALRRASIMSSDAGRGVQFSFAAGGLEVRSSNPDLGEAVEEVAIEYKGASFQVGFNPRYFLDLLEVLEDEKVVLELKDEVSPCVIRSEFDRGFLALVMPMRI
jgi:DNA polymerase-3 subunit beta